MVVVESTFESQDGPIGPITRAIVVAQLGLRGSAVTPIDDLQFAFSEGIGVFLCSFSLSRVVLAPSRCSRTHVRHTSPCVCRLTSVSE